MTICVRCVDFFVVCFIGKSENLAKMPTSKEIFIFVENGHYFEKLVILVEILNFLKRLLLVFKSDNL